MLSVNSLSPGPLSFDATAPVERFAKLSIWGILTHSVLTLFVAFSIGAKGNVTAVDWLISLILCPLALLSHLGFVLAISRYRRSCFSICFVILFFVLTTLLLLAIASNGIGFGSPPDGYDSKGSEITSSTALMAVTMVLSISGTVCLITLRAGDSLIRRFRQRTEAQGVLPRWGWTIYVSLLHLWGGLGCRISLAIARPSNVSESISFYALRVVFKCVYGAVMSQLTLVFLLSMLIMVVYTMSLIYSSRQSIRVARWCILCYVVLTLFTLLLEDWILLLIAYWSGMLGYNAVDSMMEVATGVGEMAVGNAVTKLLPPHVQAIAFGLSLIPAAFWVIGGILAWRAVGKLKVTGLDESSRVKTERQRELLVSRTIRILKNGGASMGLSVCFSVMIVMLSCVLSTDSTMGHAGIFEIVLLSSLFCPATGVVAVTAIAMRPASHERMFSWEPWEYAAQIWLAHVILVGMLFVLFVVSANLILAVVY